MKKDYLWLKPTFLTILILDLVKYYLSAGAIIDAIGGDLNSTPLHWAVRQGHQSMVALLVDKGAGKF